MLDNRIGVSVSERSSSLSGGLKLDRTPLKNVVKCSIPNLMGNLPVVYRINNYVR